MLTNYKFSINGQDVTPHWSPDLAVIFDKESEQEFFRRKLSGKLTFIQEDFVFLDAQAFDTEYELLIQKKDPAGVFQDYWEGVFYKTDCKWRNTCFR